MAHAQPVKPKGTPWFSTPGRPGDRTLDQQLMGLEPLFAEVAGKTVLDVGCAEGLISIECMMHGAFMVMGLDSRPDAIATARQSVPDSPPGWLSTFATFKVDDANTLDFGSERNFDIILLLAVLHKLRDPSAACRRLVAAARDLVVIRLPPDHAPDIVDDRSGGTVHRIGDVMADSGFALEHSGYLGPFGEWMGYYRRVVK